MKVESRDGRILEGLNTAVLVFDRSLRLTYLNPAGENLLAVSLRQASGHGVLDLLPGATTLSERLRCAIEGNQPYTEHELHLHLPGGREITVDCVVTPIDQPERD